MTPSDVFASSGLEYVSLRTYKGLNEDQRSVMIPPVPAIYSWVFDFTALLGLKPESIHNSISKFEDQKGQLHKSRLGNYDRTTLQTERPPMRPERRDRIVFEIQNQTSIGRTAASLATLQQRPLYCGITTNLSVRLDAHLSGSTDLVNRIGAIEMADCALLWTHIDAEIPDPSDGSCDDSSGTDDLLDSDLTSADFDEVAAQEVVELTMLESLLIRTSMPLMNRSIDS